MNPTVTPFALSTQATRAGLFSLAAIVTTVLLTSVSSIADRQVDEVLVAQSAQGNVHWVAAELKTRSGV